MTENEALKTIGCVAAWMQMEGLLPDGVEPDWKKLEYLLVDRKSKRKQDKYRRE